MIASPAHSAETYRVLFERSPQPTWVIDRETLGFLAVNEEAVRQYGYSRDEFLRMTARDIRPPEEVTRLESMLPLRDADAADDGSRWVHRRRDGSLVDVVVAAAAIVFEGRPARLVTVRDVTDAVRAERALRESERRFRSAMQHAPIGMALVGMDGRWLAVNDALRAILQRDEAELLSLTFQDVTHPDDLEADLALLHRLVAGEIPWYEMEKRYLRGDDRHVWALLTVSLVRDEAGTPLHFISQIQDVDTRRRLDQALRVSEAKFSGIVALASDAIISVDGEGRIVLFNQAAERVFGHARADVLGRPVEILLPPAQRDGHARGIRAFLASDEVVRPLGERGRIEGLRASGESFPAEASISRLQVGDETLLTAVLRDISERVRAEEALRGSEEHFRSMIENASDVITVLDAAGTIRYESPSVERVLGYRPEELVGEHAFDRVHPDDVAATRTAFAARVEGRDVGTAVEMRFRHRDGSWRVLEARGANRLDDPAINGIIVNSRDVTERCEAEAALRAEEARFLRIAANAPGMIYRCILRADGRVEFPFVSEGVREMYGLEPEAIMRNPATVFDVVVPEDRPGFNRSVAESAEQLTPWIWEGRVRLRDGRTRWLRGTSRPTRIDAGDVMWDGMLTDITPLKEAEMRVAAYSRELERSNRELQDFAHVASHDLQEPLRKIQAFGDRLASRYSPVLGEQGADYVARMQNAASRMQTLIGDLLEFSRVRSRRGRVQLVSLDEVAREVVSDLEVHGRPGGCGAAPHAGGRPHADAAAPAEPGGQRPQVPPPRRAPARPRHGRTPRQWRRRARGAAGSRQRDRLRREVPGPDLLALSASARTRGVRGDGDGPGHLPPYRRATRRDSLRRQHPRRRGALHGGPPAPAPAHGSDQ